LRVRDIPCFVAAIVLLLWYYLFTGYNVVVDSFGNWTYLIYLPLVVMALIVSINLFRRHRREHKKLKRESKTELLMRMRPSLVEDIDRE